ncbi:MAG TPA: hypothetical protein VN088_14500 [Nocardioides sp.]|nr:hypothetical protein [Nocardioides sp.]
MTDTIPDGLPTLSRGSHLVDEGRACVMEYVSVLAGERWSDRPACTDELRELAAAVAS